MAQFRPPKAPPAVDKAGRKFDPKKLPDVNPFNTPVLLNVYDLGESKSLKRVNAMSSFVGGGVYHSGIEIHGAEWSYGYTEYKGTGVNSCYPRCHPGHTYKATVDMGRTKLTKAEIDRLIDRMAEEWQGPDYHLIHKNCNDFCSAFTDELGVGRMPAWVDRYGRTAKNLVKNPEQEKDKSRAKNFTTGFGLGKASDDGPKKNAFGIVVTADDSDEDTFFGRSRQDSRMPRRDNGQGASLESLLADMNDFDAWDNPYSYGNTSASQAWLSEISVHGGNGNGNGHQGASGDEAKSKAKAKAKGKAKAKAKTNGAAAVNSTSAAPKDPTDKSSMGAKDSPDKSSTGAKAAAAAPKGKARSVSPERPKAAAAAPTDAPATAAPKAKGKAKARAAASEESGDAKAAARDVSTAATGGHHLDKAAEPSKSPAPKAKATRKPKAPPPKAAAPAKEDIDTTGDLEVNVGTPRHSSKNEGIATDNREVLVCDVFNVFDGDRNGFLDILEMKPFAAMFGFEGDEAAWAQWYGDACVEVNAIPERGFLPAQFGSLVADASDDALISVRRVASAAAINADAPVRQAEATEVQGATPPALPDTDGSGATLPPLPDADEGELDLFRGQLRSQLSAPGWRSPSATPRS